MPVFGPLQLVARGAWRLAARAAEQSGRDGRWRAMATSRPHRFPVAQRWR